MSMQNAATCFADHATQHTVAVSENQQIAQDTYRLRFRCPEIARRVTPGQFLMIRLSDWDDPLIGRPLALYDTPAGAAGEPESIDVVYLVGGKMTRRLARFKSGQLIDVWGPLGNGFPPQSAAHLIMVAGGIGQTPFLALAKEHLGLQQYGEPRRSVEQVERVTFCFGARTKALLGGENDFRQAGVDVRISTDDGSAGRHGLVTDVLKDVLDESTGQSRCIVCCGPEPMMKAVTDIARQYEVAAQVSLETPMACGIGICFSCVAMVQDETGEFDYRRTCVEGPVFPADRIQW
jgi:dihydroorotate dehydrogenase electron transfer subunit